MRFVWLSLACSKARDAEYVDADNTEDEDGKDDEDKAGNGGGELFLTSLKFFGVALGSGD